jgi:hypothetical protein
VPLGWCIQKTHIVEAAIDELAPRRIVESKATCTHMIEPDKHAIPTPGARRTGEGAHTLVPYLQRQAQVQLQSIYEGQARGDARESEAAAAKVKQAHDAWTARRIILTEAENQVVTSLDVFARTGKAFPQLELDALKAARAECTKAFDHLMRSLDEAARSAGENLER